MAKATEIVGLDCAAPVLSEIKRTALVRLEEIFALREAALDFSDAEGVHDMRVATRRLRGLLRDFKPYFVKNISPKKLKAVADALGAVRDADVAVAALEKLATHKNAEITRGLAHFADAHRTRRIQAREQLQHAISEKTLTVLREEFIAQLERATKITPGKQARKSAKANRSTSFREASREIVFARFAELQDESRSLYRPFATAPLHRLRISAKRLRYAIELSAQCYGNSLAPFAESVSKLQTHLGELHDCDVWIAELGARLAARQSKHDGAQESASDANPRVAEEQTAAAVWLLSYFVKERTKHYRDALALWHSLETDNFHARLTTELTQFNRTFIIQPINLFPADVTDNA